MNHRIIELGVSFFFFFLFTRRPKSQRAPCFCPLEIFPRLGGERSRGAIGEGEEPRSDDDDDT
jgi:hypothetical protein